MNNLPALPEMIGKESYAAFANAGLTGLVNDMAGWIRDTVDLARSGTVLAPRSVIDTLVGLDYDPDDRVYVVWRTDGRSDFWTQPRKERYLAYLERNIEHSGRSLNQQRVMVYDDRMKGPNPRAESWNVVGPEHIFHALRRLHDSGSLVATPALTLARYPLVEQLRFGYTVSERHGYAVVPVPFVEDLEPAVLFPDRIGAYLAGHRDYDVRDGPMRAVITAAPGFVADLLRQTTNLISDPAVEPR